MVTGNTLAEAWVELGVNAKKLTSGLKTARSKVEGFQEKLGQLQASVNKFALAAGGALVAAGQRFGTFEQSMLNVKAVMGDLATDSSMAQLTDAAKEMGATTQFTAKQSADALVLLSRAGFDASEQLKLLPEVLNLAAADGLDIATTADIVAKAMRGMELSAGDASNLVDTLAKASATANTDVTQLGAALEKIGPIGKSQGRALTELTAAAQVLADAGFQGAEGGNALRRILTRLIAPSKQAKDLMEAYNISVADANGNLLPLADVIDQVQVAFAKMNQEQRAVATSLLAGQTAMSQFSALVAKGGDALRGYENRLGNVDGTAEKMRNTMESGLLGAFTKMTSAVDAMVTAFGENLAPMLTDITHMIRRSADSIKGLIDAYPNLTRVVGMTGAAVVVFAGALTGLASAASAARLALIAISFATGGVEAVARTATQAQYGYAAALRASTAAAYAFKAAIVGVAVVAAVELVRWAYRASDAVQNLNDELKRHAELKGEMNLLEERREKRQQKRVDNASLKDRIRLLSIENEQNKKNARGMVTAIEQAEQNIVNARKRAFANLGKTEGSASYVDQQLVKNNELVKTFKQDLRDINEAFEKKRLRIKDVTEQIAKAKEQLTLQVQEERKAAEQRAKEEHDRVARAQALLQLERKIAGAKRGIAATEAQIDKLEGQSGRDTMQSVGFGQFNSHIQSQLAPKFDKQVEWLRKLNDVQKKQLSEMERQTQAIENFDGGAKFQAPQPAGSD